MDVRCLTVCIMKNLLLDLNSIFITFQECEDDDKEDLGGMIQLKLENIESSVTSLIDFILEIQLDEKIEKSKMKEETILEDDQEDEDSDSNSDSEEKEEKMTPSSYIELYFRNLKENFTIRANLSDTYGDGIFSELQLEWHTRIGILDHIYKKETTVKKKPDLFKRISNWFQKNKEKRDEKKEIRKQLALENTPNE